MASVSTKVDRHLTTPFLLKVFYKVNCFHRLEDFRAQSQPTSFVEVYTWKDCTLTELATLLLSALPNLSTNAIKCSFRLIYADTRSKRFVSQDVGNIGLPIQPNSAAPGKSLDDIRFVVGDWIDVAVTTSSGGGIGAGGGGGGGSQRSMGRENGMRVRGARAGARLPVGEWRRGERIEDGGSSGGTRNSGGGGSGGGGGGGGARFGGNRRGDRW